MTILASATPHTVPAPATAVAPRFSWSEKERAEAADALLEHATRHGRIISPEQARADADAVLDCVRPAKAHRELRELIERLDDVAAMWFRQSLGTDRACAHQLQGTVRPYRAA